MDVPRTKAEERLTRSLVQRLRSGEAMKPNEAVLNIAGALGLEFEDHVQSFVINPKQESNSVEAIGLLVTLEARRGKEADAEAFLKSAKAARAR